MGGLWRGSFEVPMSLIMMTRGASRATLALEQTQGRQEDIVGAAVGDG